MMVLRGMITGHVRCITRRDIALRPHLCRAWGTTADGTAPNPSHTSSLANSAAKPHGHMHLLR